MKLSIVTTMYHSAPYLQEFYERITKSANKITEDYEIIFVDDGSPDNSLELAVKLHKQDSRIKVIELSRNFGHHKAIMTGLEHAQGDYTFLIDCDLEESPELLNDFWEKIHADQCDVIYGVQKKRDDKLISRILGTSYYYLVNFFSEVNIPKNLVTVRLMKKKYVNSLIEHGERELNIAHLWQATGYAQKLIKVEKKKKDCSSYTNKHKVKVLINSIVSFSARPLYFICLLGIFVSFVSMLMVIETIIRYIFYGGLPGWTSLIISIWAFSGLIIFSIGVLGIYISKIFTEVKLRPRVIIKERHEKQSK